jgi:hypothetical protein
VIVEAADVDAIAPLEESAFRSTRVQRAQIADALLDAVRWLDAQPRSSREIVFAGALRRGSIEAADLAVVPSGIGIRFEQTATDGPLDLPVSILTRREGRLMRVERAARLTSESTRVTEGAATPVPPDLVTISARPRDAALADAALRAALDAGVPWRDFESPVTIVWSGGGESAIGPGTAIVRMPAPDPPSSAADAVLAELMKIGRPAWVEPLAIPKQQLDAWSRRSGPPAVDTPIGESDRRWLWALTLALLGAEWWLRRSAADRSTAIDTTLEKRVA